MCSLLNKPQPSAHWLGCSFGCTDPLQQKRGTPQSLSRATVIPCLHLHSVDHLKGQARGVTCDNVGREPGCSIEADCGYGRAGLLLWPPPTANHPTHGLPPFAALRACNLPDFAECKCFVRAVPTGAHTPGYVGEEDMVPKSVFKRTRCAIP